MSGFGTCPKCGGEMDMHYVVWCPKCDKPEDVSSTRTLEFFRVAKYIAAQEGYDYTRSSRENWYRQVLNNIEFPGNDCYVSYKIPPKGAEEDYYYNESLGVMRQFDEGLKKHFDCKAGETITLSISW